MREYLTSLLDEYEQIALNQISRLEAGLSEEQFVYACKKASERLVELRISTEKLLREHLNPTLDDIAGITDEFEDELYSAAQKLSAYKTRHDPGLALKIYKALLSRAREKQDDAKILKYLYWCGITLHFTFPEAHEKILAYFEEGAAYAAMYDSFIAPETRQYIHRCLGNVCMVYYSLGEPEKARAREELVFSFWNELMFGGKDMCFPWLNYFLACLNHRHGYLSENVHADPDSETKASLLEILDNAIMVNRLYQKNRESFSTFGGTRYDFMLWEAQFLTGLISFDHLVENINRKKAEFAPDDFSADAMYVKIQLNSYLMFYAAKMKKLRDRKDEIIAVASKDSIKQFASIPMSVSPVDVNAQLQMFAKNLSDILTPVEQLEFVMQMTTFRHIPTYAHSILVGSIASFLTEYLTKNDPGYFIGYLNLARAEDVRDTADGLCQFAKMAGLCHDIGKIACVSNPFMFARVLTEEELETVRRHPEEGVSMMVRDDGVALNNGYIEVIAGHHKHYDNIHGYPESYNREQSQHAIMVDIVTVANSIVAATDDIGKTYTMAKSLENVCEEIKVGAGTRYSPKVADILKDNSAIEAIAQILDTGRWDAYYKAYIHAWGGRDRK